MLLGYDNVQLLEPLKEFIQSEVGQGRWPSWYPYDGTGYSLAGALVPGLYDPLNLLLLLMPATAMVKWASFLADLIGAVGTYALARATGAGQRGSLLAGLAFGLAGTTLSHVVNLQYASATGWLPWALWAAERLGRRPDARLAPLWGLFLAATLWSGDPESLLGATLASVALLLRHRLPWRTSAVLVGVAGVVSVVLAAPVLLPAIHTFAGSERGEALLASEASSWSLHPLRLFEVFLGSPFPLDHGSGDITARFGGQNGLFWSRSVYCGAGVCALALRGARVRAQRAYVALTVGALALSLGSYLGLYGLLPVLSHFRYPEKLMVWATLGIAVLAAHGLAGLRPPRGQAVLRVFLGIFVAVAAGLSYGLPLMALWGLRAMVVVGAGLMLFRAPRSWARWAIVALCVMDLRLANMDLVDHGAMAEWVPTTSPLPEGQPGDRMCADFAQAGFTMPLGSRWADVRKAQLETLCTNHQSRFGMRSVAPLTPAMPAALRTLCSVQDLCNDPCARMVGARLRWVSPEDVPRLLAEGGLRQLRTLAVPKAVLLEDAKVPAYAALRPVQTFDTDWSAIVHVHRGEWLPGERALVRADEAQGLGDRPGAGTATVAPGAPDHLKLHAASQGASLLVVREALTADWHGWVDGAPVALVRADLGFIGVPVPDGAHAVELVHRPWGQPWTLGLALAALLATLGLTYMALDGRWKARGGSL
jgi:hypothetical protein